MFQGKAYLSCAGLLWFAVAQAQSPDAIVQQAVGVERAANQGDHSIWMYLEDLRTPKEHVLQWVAATEHGKVCRVLARDDRKLPTVEQRALIDKFIRDPKAQKKEIEEASHDDKQVDDFLKLLPEAFYWTQTGATATSTTLHFEPNLNFHPPTREARVFSGMAGDLAVDNAQHRIRSMNGHLVHDVTFGGGLLGRLKQGSSFALEQAHVGENLWQLTAIHVHLDGNALLFKSISLQEEDVRAKFEPEHPSLTLDQAAAEVMSQPEAAGQSK